MFSGANNSILLSVFFVNIIISRRLQIKILAKNAVPHCFRNVQPLQALIYHFHLQVAILDL